MKKNYFPLLKQLVLIFIVTCTTISHAKTGSHSPIYESIFIGESNSFNAKKRSSFSINKSKEQLDRGLTVIHFFNNTTFEFKTFDTHGSSEAVAALEVLLPKLIQNKAQFAILAHDSAAKALKEKASFLAKLGLNQLSILKSRQAYFMHNLSGKVIEQVDDMSISTKLTIPASIADTTVYFPRDIYTFEPNNNRYIAHAGGEVNGIKSTNTKNALDESYAKGFRFFELDIITTSDGKLVAAHDWNMWARFTDFEGELPPTHQEFMKHKIYGDYTTLDMDGINNWFKEHSDATLVTDKLNDPITFAEAFIDKDRLLMEVFSVMVSEDASKHGLNVMLSQIPFMSLKADKLDFLKINNIKYVALSRRMVSREKKLLKKLRDNGIKVYVYHVNFDEGKDEKYVYENEIGLVYGMYADKWVFETPPHQ